MAITKAEAVVVRAARMGETSKLLTLYSRERGILKIIAKGVRSSKSRIGGYLEPVNVVEVVYYYKPQRELQILSQAALVYAPKRLRDDPEKSMLASACGEMLSRLEDDEDVSRRVYTLMLSFLRALEPADHKTARLLFFAFQMQMLNRLGYDPGLSRCKQCNKTQTEGWYYHTANATLMCSNCERMQPHEAELSHMQVEAMRRLISVPMDEVFNLRITREVQVQIHEFIKAFYQYHLSELLNLKALSVLQQMRAFSKKQ